jgi:predicted aminopeptidase
MSLATHARPISEVLKDEKVSPRIRSLLSEIDSIKKFGEENGLKPTKNYTDYVKLNRGAAVYVVSASEPLRFKSVEWKFPIVGSFPYLGWFDLKNAKEFADELKMEGWDVDLRGASAYSTLGWFRDAVLSTMIPEGEEAIGELVNVVLHESVHATLYIKGQAYFNESVASFVADRLVYEYLNQSKGQNSPQAKAYLEAEQRSENIKRRLHQAYRKLSDLYASSKTPSEKLREKQVILAKLKEELKFKREINNATLIQYTTYDTGGKEFEELFNACGSSWRRFMELLSKKLDTHSFFRSQQEDLKPVLEPLIQAKCS